MEVVSRAFHILSGLTLWIGLMSQVTVCEISVSRTTTSIIPTSTSATNNESDTVIWRYLLEKYSTSGSSLTSSDITKIILGLQKCNGTNTNNPCQKSSTEDYKSSSKASFVVNPSCEVSWLQSDKEFNTLSDLSAVCHKILYFGSNPICCDSLVFSNEKSYQSSSLTGGNGAQSLNSNFGNDAKKLSQREKPSSGEVWGYGILCVTIISLSSLAGVSVMPFMKKEFYKHLLTALVGLAVGSLTGSAVFHLLPQAFGLSDNDPNHDYLSISLVCCGGIWMFFMVERILKFIMDYKDRKEKHWKREKMTTISHAENSTISMLVENGNCLKDPPRENGDMRNGHSVTIGLPNEPGVIYECQEQAIKASFGHQERPRLSGSHDHSVKFEQGKDSVIATVAWMIIFGDGLHNFIDGLSIGAAFNESILTGVSISVAVLCEELPHELGDFAVLLNAGMSIRQALTYNFLSACTCYIGMGFGILLGEIQATVYIFALAGGMFLYIALVDMVPEMNEIAEETSKISVKKGMKVLLLQNLGLFAGITTLFLLAKYQDNIQF